MTDPVSITASAISIAHVVKRLYDIGNAAYKSKEEKRKFNNVINNLNVQVTSLQLLEQRAFSNEDDPRYAGFRAVLKSSKQFRNGKDVEPDPDGKEPGGLQRLEYEMDQLETKLKVKHGFRAGARRLLWFHEREEFEKTIAQIKQWTDIVDSILRYDHQIMAIETDDHVKDTSARVKGLEDLAVKADFREERKAVEKAAKLREIRRLEIVKWISPLRFRERQNAILNQAPLSAREPNLVRTEEFGLWARGRPWILYCEGKPGAGKTLLCALVGRYLNSLFQKEGRNIPILYIYLNDKERDTQSVSNLFASLLKQFIQLPGTTFQSNEAQRLYQGPESESRPGWKEFYKAFCAEVTFYERVVVIVDALDEASPVDVTPQLLNALHKLPKDHTSIMVTSQRTEDGPPLTLQIECNHCKKRPLKAYYQCNICQSGSFYMCQECKDKELTCEDELHELTQPRQVLMDIEPTNGEIKDYVRAEFQAEEELGGLNEDDNTMSTFGTTPLGRLCVKKPWLREEILNSIVAKADGMFALAQLYLSSFRSLGLTEEEILEMLDDPPAGYSGLYEQHMERISEDSLGRIGSNVGMSALLWVVCARRPLRFSELQDALAINLKKVGFFNPSARRDKETVVRATAGLITIDSNEDAAVRLTHGTAQVYFDKNRDRWFPNASAQITRVSLHYLSLKQLASPGKGEWEDKEFEMRGVDYPFLEYAYRYWGDHANDASSDSDAQLDLIRFVSDEDRVSAAVQAMWYLKSEADVDWDVRKGGSALHLCAWFGLNYAISSLLDQGMEVDSRDPKFAQTPLMYACRRGKTTTAKLLLDRGAHINSISSRGTSAVFEAVLAGHVDVLKILLDQPEIDVNAPHPRRSNQTALSVAAGEGKVDIVRALLDHDGLDAYRKDANNNTALLVAIRDGQTSTVMQILDHEGTAVQLDSVNWTGSSALMLAAEHGQKEVVDKLLSKGANPSLRDNEGGGTALLRAIDNGHVSIVESMLRHPNVDIHCLDDSNRGLLHGAARAGFIDIVQLLLEKDLDINAQDNKGKTPLQDASQSGDIGADGAFEVVRLLLNKGADASLRDQEGRTAWAVAWQQGHRPVMKVLEGKEPFELTEQDWSGEYPNADKLPVWALANLGLADHVAKAIATRPREIYYLDPDTDDTALHCAVSSDRLDIIEMLLTAGLSAEAKNQYHRTPLHLAALYGTIPILELLLMTFQGEEEAQAVNAPDIWGSSPLIIAHSRGNIICCLLLIEAGATIPPSKASIKQSLYFSAIENGRLEAVQRLVYMGADIQMKNVLGLTGLQMAKQGGKADVERFLRRSKSMKVEGLGLGLEMTGTMDDGAEVDSVLEKTTTGASSIGDSRNAGLSRKVSESVASPALSLEERFRALEVPSRRSSPRTVDEEEPSRGKQKARQVRIPQLA